MNKSLLHRLILFVCLLALLLAIAVVFHAIQRSLQKPRNVTLSNLSESQVTISWTTDEPTDQQVIITTSLNSLPNDIPLLSKGTIASSNGISQVHSVTLRNLKPSGVYYYRIYQKPYSVYQGRIKLAEKLTSLSKPYPVYGRVLGPDRKAPLSGALVYLRAFNPKEASKSSSLISTTTNADGRWSLDLSLLRKANLKEPYQLTEGLLEEIVVEAGSLGRVRATTTIHRDEPWPDVFLVSTEKRK